MTTETFNLTDNQQECFDAAEQTNDNLFITGKPGVGKSVLIRALIEQGLKSYTLAAPTGLAALNIGGKTLHSIFRLPTSKGIIDPTYNQFPVDDRVLNNIRYNIKHLIIDEVSMVRADAFDYIDRLLRYAKNNNRPFGGIQVTIVGDFYQLPPVVVREEVPQLKAAGYDSPFVFSSKVFKDNFNIMSLHEVLRQKGDDKFITILDHARTGQMLYSDLQALNACVGVHDGLRISLCGKNQQAEDINRAKLNSLEGNATTFIGNKFGEWPALPVEEVVGLKVGAQVMVKLNAADRPNNHKGEFLSRVVNGTLAIVKEARENEVDITLENGEQVTIYRKRWEQKIKERGADGEWSERVVASFEQMPLALAWAISIHKSQGQTFERVHIDASSIFAAGQFYVALSRVKSLAGLSLQSKVDARKFWTDKAVTAFFKQLEIENV